MSVFDSICEKWVTPKDGESVPEINAVIAGWTTAESTQYLGAKGVKNVETGEPVSVESKMCLFSCTKSMTAMAILILWERGQVDLDAPAKTYIPALGEFGVIDDDQVDVDTGDLKYPPRKPKKELTIRNLLLHNSGFAYIFSDNNYLKIMSKKRLHAGKPSRKMFEPMIMPLVHDPGTAWTYGHGYDWIGLIVEAVSGLELSKFLEENVFSKANMKSCTFKMTDTSSLVRLHDKSEEVLELFKKKPPVPLVSEVDMGGQGCFATIGDYLKFLRIWLNYGKSPDTGNRILTKKTVEYAIQNHLPNDQKLNFPLPASGPSDGYTLAGCAYNRANGPNGRAAGSLFWTGLANLFFWIDFQNNCAGIWGCQILPYMDRSCVEGFYEFEREVYRQAHRWQSKI